MPTLATDPRKATTRARRGAPPRELIFGDLWEYDPAPETADPTLKSNYDLFIGGRFVAAQEERTFASINPANEKTLARIALAGTADVDAAFRAARRAYERVWSKTSPRDRGKYLFRL